MSLQSCASTGKRDGAVVFRLQETLDRRYEAGSARAPINNAAYAAAYLLDPHYAVNDIQAGQVVWIPPEVSVARREQAEALVQRMGRPQAARKMSKLMLGGYSTSMSRFVEAVANAEETDCLCHQAEQ
jgi:hypothetical protein